MLTVPLTFLLALVAALLLTPAVRWAAPRLGAVDAAGVNARKVHTRTVPRMGGLAIAAAFYLPLLGLFLVESDVGGRFLERHVLAMGLLMGGLPILALGVYDDIVGARARHKFLVQFGVALGMWALGFRIETVSLPFGGALELGLLSVPVTIFWIVGLINAMNLIDGLDGLAAGVAFFGSLTTLVMALATGNVLMSLFMAALTGALLGFLVYNFNPASIFMGDTGSMFLGFVLAVTAVQTSTKGATTVALLTPLLAFGLPIIDTLLAMLRRFVRGQSMFSADREHIHHRLLALGLSHRRVVVILYGASVALGFTALFVSFNSGPKSAVALVAMGVVAVVLMRRIGFFQMPDLPGLAVTRRRNGMLRQAARGAQLCLRGVASDDDLIDCMVQYALAIGADHVRVVRQDDGSELREVCRPGANPAGRAFATGLAAPGTPWVLELAWFDGRAQMAPEKQLAVQAFLGDIRDARERLAGRPRLRVAA